MAEADLAKDGDRFCHAAVLMLLQAHFVPKRSCCHYKFIAIIYMGMDQYLLIPFLGEWTSIYQLFWCSPGVQGFDTLPYIPNYEVL